MRDDHCPQAISKFQSSHQLDPSAASLMNIGTCYVRLGRTATAWRTFRQAAAAAAAEGDEELKSQAFKAISILEPKLTKLRIVTKPGAAPAPNVTLNGEALAAEDSSGAIPLDPGENLIEAKAPSGETWRRTIRSSELGATIVIEVPDLAPPPEQPKIAPAWRTGAVVTCGVGVSGIVAGLVLGASAASLYEQSESGCNSSYCDPAGYELRERASARANLSTVVVGAGALVATTGVVLLFVAPKDKKSGVGLSPWLPSGGSGFGAFASGRL